MECEARHLVSGEAAGRILALDGPLSFWGGVDAETGDIIDVRHRQHGVNISASILLVPHGRGSSSASSVLAEAIRIGTAPAAIVLSVADEILVLGALVAQELYDIDCPIVVVAEGDHENIGRASQASISARGLVEFE